MQKTNKHVKVCLRTRPSTEISPDIRFNPELKLVSLNYRKKAFDDQGKGISEKLDFRFDQIFNNSSQESVYQECSGIVGGIFEGINGTVFAYGQTVSGSFITFRAQEKLSQ
jgi:kinesin family protein 6/9